MMDNLTRRTPEQIREHYEVEKELASRLRNSTREERGCLYESLYDELFRRVPHHPQLQRKYNTTVSARNIQRQMMLLRSFLHSNTFFLEVGSGDCQLTLEVARSVRKAYGVDVSKEVTRDLPNLETFEFRLSDGTSIPVPEQSITLAYSNQLMEHLHSEDALEQLKNIYLSLAPGGRYLCRTPNRLSGPHDISGGFDQVATGLHLKEYTICEISRLFRKAGFSKVRMTLQLQHWVVQLPVFVGTSFEFYLRFLPRALRVRVTKLRTVRWLLGIQMLATK